MVFMNYKIALIVGFFLMLGGCAPINHVSQPVETVEAAGLAGVFNEDQQWWKSASNEIRRMLEETGRTVKDIEQPKWFEPGYCTLGRMPLVDTALAQPLHQMHQRDL